jgi:hypothetical protein
MPGTDRPGRIPDRIRGVDFSGAADAGKKIWITHGVNEGAGLTITDCSCGAMLPGSGTHRDQCLAALRSLIIEDKGCAFGLDFPFGLPRLMITEDDWESFILSFPATYPDADTFRRTCRAVADGVEHKRLTDREARTPFSPCNLRLYRQTYFGLRDLLHPLVRDRQVVVLPMQPWGSDNAWLLEICPAATLKREGAYPSYKGAGRQQLKARSTILGHLEASGLICIPSTSLRAKVLDDPYGDALDSLIAAFATFRTVIDPDRLAGAENAVYKLEGYVYV